MSSAEFDFKAFEEFANKVHKSMREEYFIFSVMNELGNIAIRDVKAKTPVGQYDDKVYFVRNGKLLVFEAKGHRQKQGGTLRRNWRFDGVEKVGSAYVVTIYNNTEYASFVERGHRKADHSGWVEGQFFMKITIDELMDRLPQIVGPRYREYLESLGF